MVSIKDVALKCGVSISTVSKAINGRNDVSPSLTEKIVSTAAEMGYRPNAIARTLKTNRSYLISVIFEDKTKTGLAHEYFSVLINSIKDEAEKKGYDIIFSSKNIGQSRMDFYEHSKYRNCDGVIIVSADFESQEILRLVKSEIPVVTVDHVFTEKTAVLNDNINSINSLVDYVVEKGHKKIAFIHGENTAVTQKRLASFYKACENHSITVPDEYIVSAIYHDPKSSGQATRTLMSLKNRPTCIFYPDDFSFLGGMTELEKWNCSYPKDISVIGYDGINLSQVLRPKLTTFKQNSEEVGKTAVQKLIENIEKPKMFIPEQITVMGDILIGDSVKDIN